MRIHFIAIGGAAMHNLAIALKLNGHMVTGSDDQIFDPSRSRLASHGLLPEVMGWFPETISSDLDAIILGMHARLDNPELLNAQELGLKVYSYPEFIFEQSTEKTRVVIAGSHGKTTITSMILHVLKSLGKDFDYLVGAQIQGFDTMVRLSDAPIIILEGDEYLSSPIDRRPKFHLYKPQIALISGIAWDHINVFPTWENYLEQFQIFIDQLEDGTLVYCQADEHLNELAAKAQSELNQVPYATPKYKIEDGVTTVEINGVEYKLAIFGEHNLQNMNGARLICEQIGVSTAQFMESITNFTGAARRLEEITRNESTVVYKDFAHSPSKLKATTDAVKMQWPERLLVACMELHTFSSLTKEFLAQYNGTMHQADLPIVFYKEETIAHKKLEPISVEEVKQSFGRDDLKVFTNTDELTLFLGQLDLQNKNLLMMSSGNFGGINVDEFGKNLLQA
jgi:UDP-N-acetylmuramate: L-alanyl-gamma-D-glutamyl-meso-diaminopimelate ligase